MFITFAVSLVCVEYPAAHETKTNIEKREVLSAYHMMYANGSVLLNVEIRIGQS